MADDKKILYGRYADAWAWCLRGTVFEYLDDDWNRASTEQEAKQKAVETLTRRTGLSGNDFPFELVDVPLKPPKTGSLEDTAGSISEHGVDIEWGGACPVQGEGSVDGYEAYYRSRGHGWSLTLTLSDTETWTYTESPYAFPDGGWIVAEESASNIRRAVVAFRARLRKEAS